MISPRDLLSFGLVQQKQKLSDDTGRPKTERRHRKLMFSALDEEVGNAKLSCGLGPTCKSETRPNVSGGWRAAKDKTDSWRITPAQPIAMQPDGSIFTQVSKRINQ